MSHGCLLCKSYTNTVHTLPVALLLHCVFFFFFSCLLRMINCSLWDHSVFIRLSFIPRPLSVSSPGCEAELVQLAVLPALSPAVASSSQTSGRTFWFWSPLILPVPQDPTLLQLIYVPGDGGFLSAAPGGAPPSASFRGTLLLWSGAFYWRGKPCVHYATKQGAVSFGLKQPVTTSCVMSFYLSMSCHPKTFLWRSCLFSTLSNLELFSYCNRLSILK